MTSSRCIVSGRINYKRVQKTILFSYRISVSTKISSLLFFYSMFFYGLNPSITIHSMTKNCIQNYALMIIKE